MEQAPPLGTRTRLLLQGGTAGFRISPFEGVILLAVLAGAMFGGYSAYARFTDLNAAVESPPVYFEAQRTTLTSTVSTTGTVQSSQQVTLTFGTTGKIKEFLVGLGAEVKAGQPLARIDDSDLQQTVRSAQSNLDSALARLNAAVDGPSTTDIASALQALNTARSQLAKAQQDYADLKVRPTFSELATAQQGLLQAQNALQTANDNLAKAQNDLANAQSDLATAQVNVHSTFLDVSSAAALLHSSCRPPLAEGTQAPSVQFATCTVAPTPAQQSDYNSARTAYNNALAALPARQTAVTNAQNSLNSGNLQRSIQSAQLGVQVAQQKLVDTQAGAKPSELDAGQRAIDSAQASLDAAQARYDELFSPPKPETVLPLQASVDQAKAQLETAKQNLAAATIVAPFDGVISSLTGEVGSQVGANTAVFILLNPRLIRIDASVDQADITNLKAGQTATATFDALQGRTYQATITAIGLTPTTQQGVVTYTVTFGVDTSRLAEGTPVPAPGMTASLSVTTNRVENALVVPSRSVRRVGRTSTVTVKTDQGDEQRNVITGTTNGTLTEIVSGLSDGERVLYSTGAAAPTRTTGANAGQTQFGAPGQFVVPGGSFPGGGGNR